MVCQGLSENMDFPVELEQQLGETEGISYKTPQALNTHTGVLGHHNILFKKYIC